MTFWRTASRRAPAKTAVSPSLGSGQMMIKKSADSRAAPPQPCGTMATCICKSLLTSPLESIEARPDAHAMMPRDRKGPRHKGTKNGLKDSKRENVAFAGEEP